MKREDAGPLYARSRRLTASGIAFTVGHGIPAWEGDQGGLNMRDVAEYFSLPHIETLLGPVNHPIVGQG